MFGPFSRQGGANTNNLSPDQTTALFVTQATAAALASFGANQLENASQSLDLAARTTLLVREPGLRAKLTELVQATAELMLAIDVQRIAHAVVGTGEG